MKKDELEDLFKKSFENYEAEVRPGVWRNVRIGLKWGGAALLFTTILNKIGINTIVAVLASVAAVVSTVGIIKWTQSNNAETTTSATEKTIVLPQTNAVSAPAIVAADTKEQLKESLATINKVTVVETSKKEKKKTELVITALDITKMDVTGYSAMTSAPQEFSPNGDGKLDVFVIQSKNIAHMKAKICDTKGAIVYTSDGIDAKWDGRDLQGKKAKEGIYFYLINAEGLDGKKYEQKGSINLTR